MKTRADRIKYLREVVLGLTQDELAEKLGVSRGSVGNWELEQGISKKNLYALAQLAKCTMEWVELGVGQPPAERGRTAAAVISAKARPASNGNWDDPYTAIVQGLIAGFGVTGPHAAELERLIQKVLSEPLDGHSSAENTAARRSLAQFVVREYLRANDLSDDEE